ncbi:hypothetical protein BDR26DRAFT_132991 [Obelidium mucronatum]|nr:hypothetical protein BDR26DRAFT_132991 [Obelidium mucronatum]
MLLIIVSNFILSLLSLDVESLELFDYELSLNESRFFLVFNKMEWATFPAPIGPIPHPPSDSAERDQIHTIAEKVAKNNNMFLYLLMDQESKNPNTQCRFLWPNSSSYPYFSFKVWSYRNPVEFMQLQQNLIASMAPSAIPSNQTGSKTSEIQSLIDSVTKECTKNNIQNAKNFIFKNCQTSESIKSTIELFVSAIKKSEIFQERLHVLYLVNEILMYESQKKMCLFRDAVAPLLGFFLQAPMQAASANVEKINKVAQLIGYL